jgi:histidine phosphotransferase ChpT
VGALPRGGTIDVEIAGTPPAVSFVVRAKGEAARLSDQVKSLLSGANGITVDAHLVQPYYAGRVASAAGMSLSVEAKEGEVEFKAA